MKAGIKEFLVITSCLLMTISFAQEVAVAHPSQASAPLLEGFTPCPWNSPDCNACVLDAVESIGQLRDHCDVLGFHMGEAPDVTFSKHWQGVQRLMNAGARYLVVSRNIPDSSTDVAFVVVEMGSRNTDGLRFRSNRLESGYDFDETPPPDNDEVVTVVPHQADFHHAGGMQLSGHFLAVPFEKDDTSKVVIYDLSNPLSPTLLANEIDHSDLAAEAGTASLAKLADGRFLLIIGRANANILDFYVSDAPDLAITTFSFFDTWDESELQTEIADTEFANYQNLNLLTQCDGKLFLVGTHRNDVNQKEWIDLYRLENDTDDDVVITKVAKKHLFCDDHCDLDAAGGIYVDPEGRLYVYGTEHDNDGPISGDRSCSNSEECSVKFAEFRPVPHSDCDRIQDAWVELYDDDHFNDRGLMIDFVDRDLENYTNYDEVEGFEDKASSVRWCIPSGATYRLWEDKNPCGGTRFDLVGSGVLEEIADLDEANPSFGDETSCSEWRGGPFADAGDDRVVECTSTAGTPVLLDGSGSVAINGTLDFSWSAPGTTFDDPHAVNPIGIFPVGSTVATLTVDDGSNTDSDDVSIEVTDSIAPSLSCPAPATVECSQFGGAPSDDPLVTVFLSGADVTDTCDANPILTHDAPALFGVGSTRVTFTATDHSGNSTACSSTLTVADTTPPVIESGFQILPEELWPPDHKLQTMIVPQLVSHDICDPAPMVLCSVESDEPADALSGDGRTLFDIVFDGDPIAEQGTGELPITTVNGAGSFDLLLRVERSASGDGRTYTTSCVAIDAANHRSLPVTTQSEVPHSRAASSERSKLTRPRRSRR